MLPKAEVRPPPQRVMGYYCVYHGQFFLPGFLLLTQPASFVTGDINCKNKDMTIMSSLTQYYDHQISDVILSIW